MEVGSCAPLNFLSPLISPAGAAADGAHPFLPHRRVLHGRLQRRHSLGVRLSGPHPGRAAGWASAAIWCRTFALTFDISEQLYACAVGIRWPAPLLAACHIGLWKFLLRQAWQWRRGKRV